jgi:hypothetical protein
VSVNAACYLQISKDPNQRKLGVDDQRTSCRDLCAEESWEVIGYREDNDTSATNWRADRPDYDRFLFSLAVCSSRFGALAGARRVGRPQP